jgi:hypothetical protein
MPKFTFQNMTKARVSLAIEPWALEEFVAPDAVVEFDYDQPARIEFALFDAGPFVSIMSNRIVISAEDREIKLPPGDMKFDDL